MLAEPLVPPGRSTIKVPCHFGEWIQGRLGPFGPVVLITLMAKGICLTARHRKRGPLGCHAIGYGSLRLDQLTRQHRTLDLPLRGHTLTRLPFPPGLGTGMSTASFIAHARLSGFAGPPAVLARSTIAAEGASDPLMFRNPDRLLWASRQGKVVSYLPSPFMAHIVGGFFGPPRPTQAKDTEYQDVSDLIALWTQTKSLADQAQLASESAVRCLQCRLPGPDPTADLARDLGALGWAASHSGAARSLIFWPGRVPRNAKDAMREAGLYGLCQFITGER